MMIKEEVKDIVWLGDFLELLQKILIGDLLE